MVSYCRLLNVFQYFSWRLKILIRWKRWKGDWRFFNNTQTRSYYTYSDKLFRVDFFWSWSLKRNNVWSLDLNVKTTFSSQYGKFPSMVCLKRVLNLSEGLPKYDTIKCKSTFLGTMKQKPLWINNLLKNSSIKWFTKHLV